MTGLASKPDVPTVCVQGLGFVGAAMSIAVADARRADGTPAFNVIGVDLDTPAGAERINALNAGTFPFSTSDQKLTAALGRARAAKNLVATSKSDAYAKADIIVVDVHCDVSVDNGVPTAVIGPFTGAIRTIAQHVRPGALVIVETTVPPGTCDRIVAPELRRGLAARGLPEDSVLLAHSYERVMPGDQYFDSIINFWRVYAGHTPAAAEACAKFLSQVINVDRFPLSQLPTTTASETAKILENTYRAVNIAFVDEWSRFAERAGVDLFSVIDAIRVRPTHSNIRQPGFGVGGYCLTKDPFFAPAAARDLLGIPDVSFPMSTLAVRVNQQMPLATLDRLQQLLPGGLRGKRILLLGVSYRSHVGDTRFSPSQTFCEEAARRGAEVIPQDPLVGRWDEMNVDVMADTPTLDQLGPIDAVVIAVAHEQYRDIDFDKLLGTQTPLVLDASHVVTHDQQRAIRARGSAFVAMGQG